MANRINFLCMGIVVWILSCGSSSPNEAPPSADISPVFSTTVVLQPEWPQELKIMESLLKLEATIKGKDNQGKALGSLGPVVAIRKEDLYQFVFTELPKELEGAVNLTLNVERPNTTLSKECSQVAKSEKQITLVQGEINFIITMSDWDLSMDCDRNGISNLQEFVLADRPQEIVEEENPIPIVEEDSDLDDDGILNESDNCPLVSNLDQINSDQDPFGALCDCDDNNANIHPDMVDEPDRGIDSNCDGIDGDKSSAILVSSPNENLKELVDRAILEKKDLYFQAGTYVLDDINSFGSIRFYGGFKTFSERDATSVDPSFVTVFTHHNSDTTLLLDHIEDEILFDGFHIINEGSEQDPVIGSRTIVVENSKAHFSNCKIFGNEKGTRTTAVAILGSSTATIVDSQIDGGGGEDASLGVLIEEADNVLLKNNTVQSSRGRFATGLEIIGASPTVQNNTILALSTFPASSLATAEALRFHNALGLKLNNNILATDGAANQYVSACTGLEPQADPIYSNLLTAFLSSTAVKAVSCLGEFDYVVSDGLDLGFELANGNLDYSGPNLESLLLDGRFQTLGAAR